MFSSTLVLSRVFPFLTPIVKACARTDYRAPFLPYAISSENYVQEFYLDTFLSQLPFNISKSLLFFLNSAQHVEYFAVDRLRSLIFLHQLSKSQEGYTKLLSWSAWSLVVTPYWRAPKRTKQMSMATITLCFEFFRFRVDVLQS